MLINHKILIREKNYKKIANEKFTVFLLWMISKNEICGYEIIKAIKEDHVIHSLPSSKIYPILKELTLKGFITYQKEFHGKRARKIYKITPKGKSLLKKIKLFLKSSKLIVGYASELLS